MCISRAIWTLVSAEKFPGFSFARLTGMASVLIFEEQVCFPDHGQGSSKKNVQCFQDEVEDRNKNGDRIYVKLGMSYSYNA